MINLESLEDDFNTNSQQRKYTDTRNVADEFKGKPLENIVTELDERGIELEVAVENLERDFNMGTIVRNANAFGVRHVHVVGRHQWNKRGAMATDKYLHVNYFANPQEFTVEMKRRGKTIIAVDNIDGAIPLHSIKLPLNSVLVFGAEGPGLSEELLSIADQVVAIEQFGSTRSINVGVAAGIVMYKWMQLHKLK